MSANALKLWLTFCIFNLKTMTLIHSASFSSDIIPARVSGGCSIFDIHCCHSPSQVWNFGVSSPQEKINHGNYELLTNSMLTPLLETPVLKVWVKQNTIPLSFMTICSENLTMQWQCYSCCSHFWFLLSFFVCLFVFNLCNTHLLLLIQCHVIKFHKYFLFVFLAAHWSTG